jgi:hypothetical protein
MARACACDASTQINRAGRVFDMALPTAYLTSQKNLDAILAAITTAKAPASFTQKFLGDLGFKSSSDRLVINVFKSIGMLTDDGSPTQRYFDYLDQTQSERVLAEGVMEAYADLFQLNTTAEKMERAELVNKFRTLGEGKLTDSVLKKMAMTFKALVDHGNFDAARSGVKEEAPVEENDGEAENGGGGSDESLRPGGGSLVIDGLVYNLQIQLPESRDPKVYDALFQSLKKHLGR